MSELKVATFNCRGLRGQVKRRDVVNYLRKKDYDILLLQDTHLTTQTVNNFNHLWRGKGYHSCGSSNSRGTSILFKSNVQHEIIHEEYCKDGNFVILVCNIFPNTYTLVSIYGPNDDCPNFFDQLRMRLSEIGSENLLIGGDFNFVMNYLQDSNYSQQNNPRARNVFASLIEHFSLLDTWDELHPQTRSATWTRQNPFKWGRLD